jgi:CRISPR-associated endonuclease/helicase Cas3
VQRFGRLNRFGEVAAANAFWIDFAGKEELTQALMDADAKLNEKNAVEKAGQLLRELSLPYDYSLLMQSRSLLESLEDASPVSLSRQSWSEPEVVLPIIRRKDIQDIFDTTPDLMGNDLDVSRYIRDANESDVHVFWRDLDGNLPKGKPVPAREEICNVHIGAFRKFMKKKIDVRRWDHLGERWVLVYDSDIRPGQMLLLNAQSGGYDSLSGWTGETGKRVEPTPSVPQEENTPDGYGITDKLRVADRWITLSEHSMSVSSHCRELAEALRLDPVASHALEEGGLRHDVGKAIHGFQSNLSQLVGCREEILWAKSPKKCPKKEGKSEMERRYLRHELASAMAYLQHCREEGLLKDLVAYLILAHHGKVRMTIRSFPNEPPPKEPDRLFACGVWDGEDLPEVDLGNGRKSPALKIDLTPMRMGEGGGGSSWISRTKRLLEALGPFRLAFLEALLRVADWRVSMLEGESNE